MDQEHRNRTLAAGGPMDANCRHRGSSDGAGGCFYLSKTTIILCLLSIALIKLMSFSKSIDVFVTKSTSDAGFVGGGVTQPIPCDTLTATVISEKDNNHDETTETAAKMSKKRTSILQSFVDDPNPDEPWPRIAWLMTYPNSVSNCARNVIYLFITRRSPLNTLFYGCRLFVSCCMYVCFF